MNISILHSDSKRPLFVDFEKYTDGDTDFQKELAVLMIDNIYELLDSLKSAEKNMDVFMKITHKIKPTIEMLEDAELNEAISNVKNASDKRAEISVLRNICEAIVKSLKEVIS